MRPRKEIEQESAKINSNVRTSDYNLLLKNDILIELLLDVRDELRLINNKTHSW